MARDEHVQSQLSALLDNALPPAERSAVEEHLKSCATCRAEFEALQHQQLLMKASSVLTPPDSLYRNVMKEVREPERESAATWWGLPFKAIATACVVMVVVLVSRSRKETQPVTESYDRISQEARPQLETAVPYQSKNEVRTRDDIQAGNEFKKDVGEKVALKEAESSAKPVEKMKGIVARSLPAAPAYPQYAREMNGAATQQSFREEKPAKLADRGRSAAKSSFVALSDKPAEAADEVAIIGGRKQRQSGAAQMVLVKDAATWAQVWQQRAPRNSPMPTVDFVHDCVVVIIAAEKPTAGYGVSITRVENQPDQLVVFYQETTPDPGMATAQVLTYPWAYRIMPKTSLPIRIQPE